MSASQDAKFYVDLADAQDIENGSWLRGYSGSESSLSSSPTVYSSEVVAAEKELLNSHNLVAAVACKEDVDDDSRDDQDMRDCACMNYCLHGVANSESSASALTADFELDEDEDQDEMG